MFLNIIKNEKKINLLSGSNKELDKKAMLKVRGGCGCGCCGTSSHNDNACANADGGQTSPPNRDDGSGVECK